MRAGSRNVTDHLLIQKVPYIPKTLAQESKKYQHQRQNKYVFNDRLARSGPGEVNETNGFYAVSHTYIIRYNVVS